MNEQLSDFIESLRFRLAELKGTHDTFSCVIPTPMEEGTAAGIDAAISVFEAEVLMAKSR